MWGGALKVTSAGQSKFVPICLAAMLHWQWTYQRSQHILLCVDSLPQRYTYRYLPKTCYHLRSVSSRETGEVGLLSKSSRRKRFAQWWLVAGWCYCTNKNLLLANKEFWWWTTNTELKLCKNVLRKRWRKATKRSKPGGDRSRRSGGTALWHCCSNYAAESAISSSRISCKPLSGRGYIIEVKMKAMTRGQR